MATTAPTSTATPVRLVSLNIRFATTKPYPGEALWSERCPRLCAQLRFLSAGHTSAFLCLQEVLEPQLADVLAALGPKWEHVGVGRNDGKAEGEFSPVLFRADLWDCERHKTFWLSETPETPSRGWDADQNRVVTVATFRQRGDGDAGTRVVVMSTHLDNWGEVSRRESGKLLLKLARLWHKDTKDASGRAPPLFLGGDFNSEPDGGAYKEITTPSSGMTDISGLVLKEKRYGNDEFTYTSFGGEEPPKRIDFLFVLDPSVIEVQNFAILPNRFDDTVFMSDHRAVVADVNIPNVGHLAP